MGYRCFNLVLALLVVNCQSTPFCNAFLAEAHVPAIFAVKADPEFCCLKRTDGQERTTLSPLYPTSFHASAYNEESTPQPKIH